MNIYNYTDFRLFLKDCYLEKKKQNSKFSYRYMANKVGYSSPSFFTLIIQGKTNISNTMAQGFCKLFKLTKRESEFFEILVHYNQAKTHEERRVYMERIARFKETGPTLVNQDQYEYYSEWYYQAIRNILSIHDFYGNYNELAKLVEPSVTPMQARKAIELLIRLNLIEQRNDGKFVVKNSLMSSGTKAESIALTNHALQMLDLSKNALNRMSKNERHISGVAFAVSNKTFQDMQKEIRACRQRLLELAEADTAPDRVYHLAFQIIPLSKSTIEE